MIFIASILPEREIKTQPASLAAYLYQKKIIEFCNPTLTISIIPVYIKKAYRDCENDIFYINSGRLKNYLLFNISKLIGDTWVSIRLINKYKKEKIWFYNLSKSTFFIGFFAKYLLRRKIYIIVADYNVPKTMSEKIIDRLIKKFNGAIVLNSNINIVNNRQIMPGLLRENEIVFPDSVGSISKKILLSGSLGYTTGIDFALEFFSKQPEYELYITGVRYNMNENAFNSLIEKYSQFKNIFFMGNVEYEKYIHILKDCDVCLSLRDPLDIQHDYNFPSKILEYLCYNKLVISTKYYKDLPSGLIFVTEKHESGLELTLNKIFSMNEFEIRNQKKYIYDQLKNNYSSITLQSKIKELYYE